jgi:hypothetical protein
MSDSFGNGGKADVEKAATVAHEGKHGVDDNGNSRKLTFVGDYLEERRAYTAQSFVNEGLNTDSQYGVWTQGGGFNQGEVDALAIREAMDCHAQGNCK